MPPFQCSFRRTWRTQNDRGGLRSAPIWMGQDYRTAGIGNGPDGCFLNLHWRNEPIPAAVESLDEPGAFRGIAQGQTNFVHGLVEIAVEIDESICRPQFLPNLFSGHKFARRVQ